MCEKPILPLSPLSQLSKFGGDVSNHSMTLALIPTKQKLYQTWNMEMDGFPIDVITNILTKLPVRFVLQFRSVSKIWCSIIDLPQFHKLHLDSSLAHSETHNPSSLIIVPFIYQGQLYMINDYNEDELAAGCEEEPHVDQVPIIGRSLKINLVPISSGSPLYLVGYCNGFVCFSTCLDAWDPTIIGYRIYICNPATREFAEMPHITFPRLFLLDVGMGFGFVNSTREFKVVHAFTWGEDGERKSEVQVYTLGSGPTWRTIEDTPKGFITGSSQVFVNGTLHWFTQCFYGPEIHDNHLVGYPARIVSFGLESERFGVIPNPEFSFHSHHPLMIKFDKFQLGVLGGCLSISDCYSSSDNCEIWVMKDYNVRESWTKQFVIPINKLTVPVAYRMNDEPIMLCDSSVLFSLNYEGKRITLLEDGEIPRWDHNSQAVEYPYYWYSAFPYFGSLVSPNQLQNMQIN